MPNSLKCKLSSLRYKRLLTDEEYQELIKKLDGHDREVRNKAIDEFAEKLKEPLIEWSKNGSASVARGYENAIDLINEIAEQLKGEK